MDNSPGSRALAVIKNNDLVFKKPAVIPKRRSKQKVLDEEAYIEELDKIIQRDFFPDLEKLKAQYDYLEATERNDLAKMRELHMKYSGRRPPPQRVPSPATFETPAHTPPLPSNHPLQTPETDILQPAPCLSLDQFLNTHTSQDNESFEEMMSEYEERLRKKYSYLYNEEDKSNSDKLKQLELPSIQQQCALPYKPLEIDTWNYKNKNYIMYVPDAVDLTPEQQIEMSKKRQEVIHCNTRLQENPFNEAQSKETITELARTQAKVLDGKIGVDGKELVLQNIPNVNGFSFVRTPSPHPGVTDTPLMTWGEIEGTPFRLDGSDTPLPRTPGPSFKMSEPPRREQIGLALAEKVGEKHRSQKKKAIDAARKHFASPSPRPGTSSFDRLATMSPAARLLATSKLGLSVNQTIYSPSPRQRNKVPGTPRRMITPKLNLGIKKNNDNLTDDLLTINVPKRQKASDFF